MKFVREKLLQHYKEPTSIETPTATVKIIKSKRYVLDQKALKEDNPKLYKNYIKQQEITLIQVRFK